MSVLAERLVVQSTDPRVVLAHAVAVGAAIVV
jgi:hypothetical protein